MAEYANGESFEDGFEDRSMLRRLGLAISYVFTIVYIFSILLPSLYCFRNGCRGPGEVDAFMPHLPLYSPRSITAAVSFNNAIQHIRKGQWFWVFWPLAIIFSVVCSV